MSNVLFSESEKFSTDHIYDAKWKTWCRLCANDDVNGVNIISGQCSQNLNSDFNDINIVHSIGELFRIYVRILTITPRNFIKIYCFIGSRR